MTAIKTEGRVTAPSGINMAIVDYIHLQTLSVRGLAAALATFAMHDDGDFSLPGIAQEFRSAGIDAIAEAIIERCKAIDQLVHRGQLSAPDSDE